MIVTMRITTITVTFHNTKKNQTLFFFLYFKNIFEYNFYMVIKRGANVKRHYILTVCNMTYASLFVSFCRILYAGNAYFWDVRWSCAPPPENLFYFFLF